MLPSVMVGERAGMLKLLAARLTAAAWKPAEDVSAVASCVVLRHAISCMQQRGREEERERGSEGERARGRTSESEGLVCLPRRACLLERTAAYLHEFTMAAIAPCQSSGNVGVRDKGERRGGRM